MLCYLADISCMCRLASWQAETTGALGMLSVQEISFILINATPNPPSAPATLLHSHYVFSLGLWLGQSHGAFLSHLYFFSILHIFCTKRDKLLRTALQLCYLISELIENKNLISVQFVSMNTF